MTNDWRKTSALGLPPGSVRAALALVVMGGIWTWMLTRPATEAPSFLRDLMFIILGHYFAARQRASTDDDDGGAPPPLWLPRGTVRSIIVLGFVGVFAVLALKRNLAHGRELNAATVLLVLAGGFLLGVLVSRLRRGKPVSRAFEDTRAIVSLAAGVMLLLIVFGVWIPQGDSFESMRTFMLRYRVEEILAAIVGFYFGSRS